MKKKRTLLHTVKCIFIICCLLMIGCSKSESPWEYDENYTQDLVLNISGYFDMSSVDVIQIYRPKDKKNHVLPLNLLRRERVVGELRNKDDIATFLRSFQKIAEENETDCSLEAAAQVFHIVVFDSKLLRIGYIRYGLCSGNLSTYGVIIPLADEGVFYNTEPPDFLLKVAGMKKDKIGKSSGAKGSGM